MLPLNNPHPEAALAGRVWRPGLGPCVVAIRDTRVIDITSPILPTMRDLLEHHDPATTLRGAPGEDIGLATVYR